MSLVKEQTQLVGAYSTFSCNIDAQAKDAFKEALDGLLGVDYTPVAVSSQIVAGINYRFFCNAKVVSPYSANGSAMVNIYKPLTGEAHITSIQRID